MGAVRDCGAHRDRTRDPHRLLVDEPVDGGGEDSGPTPSETLLAALGA